MNINKYLERKAALENKNYNEQIKLEDSINLDTYLINNSSQLSGFKKIDQKYLGYSFNFTVGIDGQVLDIMNNGRKTGQIYRDSTNGSKNIAYGFTTDGTIISGGGNGFLNAYNERGEETAQFIGHVSDIQALAIDGDTLVSGSKDQIIKLWNLRDLKSGGAKVRIKSIVKSGIAERSGLEIGDIILKVDSKPFKDAMEVINYITPKKQYLFQIKRKEEVKTIVIDKIDEKFGMVLENNKEIYPFLSIFISEDKQWVAWTNEGFYNASPNGDQYVGWHVNKGNETAAELFTAKQFRRYLYRPDIIKKTIELGGSKLAIEEIAKREPSIRDITLAELIKRAPVDVKIAQVVILKDGRADVTIRLGNNNTTAPERITLYVNGAQQLTEKQRLLKGAKPGDILKYKILLPDNKNTIKVTVENQWAENSNETYVDNPNGNDMLSTKNSTLYVVAVGISNYPELPLDNQLKSPPLDAKSIAEHFKRLEGMLYKKVEVKVLAENIDTIVAKKMVITSDMVEKALKEQTQKAGASDTTIIFLAGHGVTDALGSYHFVTADTKITGGLKEGTSLDWKRLHRILDKTMGRRVVIVDTCQAGEVFSDNKTDIKRLVKDVHDVNAIIYSGTSRQESGKETLKGGVFTLSMVSGFDGKAAYEANFLPFLKLKDYVDREVPRLNRDIMLGLYRGVSVKQKSEEEVIDSVQKPVAVVPVGMERFIIFAK
ncbi:MAG: caspase family protein [Nitrospirae bacterium]|nr:caspase family protein [Nitrospirota bacterium]